MESKRKANGRVLVDTDDRGSKRRKVADFDLSKGETAASTAAYGMVFLDQIRRTTDKGGRLIVSSFEKLPPREGNEEYYEQTRMPISLEQIEQKLNDHEFDNLSDLEGYFKRMVLNAREFYPRSSTIFDDAERVRKALTRYMTKANPAYSVRGYQAFATPLPPEDGEDAPENDASDKDEDEEEEEEDDDDDAEKADEDDADAEEQDEENAEENDDDGDEEAEEEEEGKKPGRGSRRRSIILKRRGPTRSSRHSISKPQQSPEISSKPDHQYEDVPYKGLSFQQAQEKLVEELLRHQEPEYEDAYFEAFINLPPRSLKDYFKVISEPLSIKKLQKRVKGIHGRNDVTGVSTFKTWSAFEEKASLLWTNAYFYNEEGSEIYGLAQELEAFVTKHLTEAQAAAPEPTQPKIKLKVGQAQESVTTPTAKKITIHVGGRDSVDSPAPQTSQSVGTPVSAQSNGASTPVQSNLAMVEKAGSVSVAAPSPSPSVQVSLKPEDAATARPASVSPAAPGTPTGATAAVSVAPQVQPPAAIPSEYMEQKYPRAPGKGMNDALISKMQIISHPSLQSPNPVLSTIIPHPTEMRQSVTVNLSAHQARIFIATFLPDDLRSRQYSLWTLLNKAPLKPIPHKLPGQGSQDRTFEVVLHPGLNVLESHLIAAIPRSERVPGGPEVELEIFTIMLNVLRG